MINKDEMNYTLNTQADAYVVKHFIEPTREIYLLVRGAYIRGAIVGMEAAAADEKTRVDARTGAAIVTSAKASCTRPVVNPVHPHQE